jgi:hypothetical protein
MTFALEAGMPNPTFSMTAICTDNEKCIFYNLPIAVVLTITNTSNAEVAIPAEFIKRKGPYLKILDSRTGKVVTMGTGMTDPALLQKLTVLPAGHSLKLSTTINADGVEEFGPAMIDVVARFSVSVPTKPIVGSNFSETRCSASIRILGKDAAAVR